jgi:hypothetical protein
MMQKLIFTLMALLYGALASHQLLAVEELKLSERFLLIGVISSSDYESNIVVLRDVSNAKTLTLTDGAKIPGIPGGRVVAIDKSQVILADDNTSVSLHYFGSSTQPVPESEEVPEEVRIGDKNLMETILLHSGENSPTSMSEEEKKEIYDKIGN